jgi:DNA topoisomerase-3
MNKKFDDKEKMLKRFNKIRCNFYVNLEKITYRKKKVAPPAGLKTISMLKMASLQLGLSPYDASKEAQKLYMNGLISYPRTKSTKYSENYDFKKSLRMFTDNPHFSEKVNDLLNDFDIKNIDFSRGEEKGGHEPIAPTDSTTQASIKDTLNWDLYICICLYYFASLSPPMEYENIDYKFTLGKYKLKLTQSKLINKGFSTFLPLKNRHFVEELPSFIENEDYKIVNIEYEKKYYSAPQFLSEAELINEMEKKHIGTDGSIPSHIKNLIKRGYVKVNEHRRIIPTKLGEVLIDALNKVVPEIVKPENRAKIEEFVKQIETGEKDFYEAIEAALSFYKEKLIICMGKIDNIKNEFGHYFELVDVSEKKSKKPKSKKRRF